jgi:hypothetical protein
MADNTGKQKSGLTRDAIKYAAVFAMLLNHAANVFLTPGTLLYEILADTGYFTAITMCYFLVEGYGFTRSKKKYGARLLIFAVLSEVPYCLAFTKEGVMSFCGLNMLFTLFICFLILVAEEKIDDRRYKAAAVVMLTLASAACDWPVMAPVFTLLFIGARGDRAKTRRAFLLALPMFFVFQLVNGSGTYALGKNILCAAGAVTGIAASGGCILYLYNGRRALHGAAFSKWFFYVFYPAHLLVLGLIRLGG